MLIDVDDIPDSGLRDLDTLDDSVGCGEVDCWLGEHAFTTHLRAYVTAVAHALGIGEESTMIDAAAPASAYLALDGRLPSYPHRELALVWDERHGWAAAVETHSGEDLLLLAYLDPRHGLVPEPHIPAEFVTALCRGQLAGRPDPPDLATPSRHHTSELLVRLSGDLPARGRDRTAFGHAAAQGDDPSVFRSVSCACASALVGGLFGGS